MGHIKTNNGPPPLVPMHSTTKQQAQQPMDAKRRRAQHLNNNDESHPFVQNVQIDLKALSAKKEELESGISSMTSASSTETENDYSSLLLHSTSSCVRDLNTQTAEMKRKQIKKCKENKQLMSGHQEYIDLLKQNEFDTVIARLQPHVEGNVGDLNTYRLLVATALFYRDKMENGTNDCLQALHFCNLIMDDLQCNDGNITYCEARKIRGLIHKKLKNYKAACHDFEYICFHNPYAQSIGDRLYAMQSNQTNTCPNSNTLIAQQNNNIHIVQNNNFLYPSPSLQLPMDMLLNHPNAMDLSNPTAPIVCVPSKVNVAATSESNKPMMMMNTSLLDRTYSDLQQLQPPKEFPPRSSSTTSSGSCEGLLALADAAGNEYDKKKKKGKKEKKKTEYLMTGLNDFPNIMSKKTTMEELLGNMNDNDGPINTANGTPEPLERVRTDAES